MKNTIGVASLTRREFLGKAALTAGVASIVGSSSPGAGTAFGAEPAKMNDAFSVGALPNGGKPIKQFWCDLNWSHPADNHTAMVPALPQDWANVDPVEYFAWHRDFGVNLMSLQGYVLDGYAFYPTKLGPVAPGSGAELFPRLFKLAEKAGMPFCGYFSIAQDLVLSNLRDDWLVPTSREYTWPGMMAPESPWTDLLCARIAEFLRLYPVQWINFDCFNYGKFDCNDFPVQPSMYVKGPFKEIIGREIPEKASDITPEESLKYKREIMARLYLRIREVIAKASPETKTNFNVPFFRPAEPMWADHPMVNDCDQLIAESSNDAIVNWLLAIRKPHQRVMTTIIGRPNEKGLCDPNSWQKWYALGCDFSGYAHGIPPDFRPWPGVRDQIEVVHNAFKQMA
jgi:hypothetical protein